MPTAQRMQLLACLVLLVVAIACGGAAAEKVPPNPTSGAPPTATGPTPSEVATPSPSPLPTSTPTTEAAPTATPIAPAPTVTIGDASFVVELAVTPQERAQGLSGRPGLAPGTGMLFIFGTEDLYSFWMKDMRFPLDMV